MIYDQGVCPRCCQKIETERKLEAVVVCAACGFVLSNSEHKQAESSHQKFIYVGVAMCALFVGALVQISIWDSYSLEVIPLQVKEMTGASKDTDFERMAQICLDRRRLNCVEAQFANLSKKDPKQLLRLGKLQMTRLHYKEAVHTYRSFFAAGGKDLEASFLYARALGQIGEYDEAGKYYRYILSARPDAIMQAATLHSYDLMQKEKRRAGKPATRGIASVSSHH